MCGLPSQNPHTKYAIKVCISSVYECIKALLSHKKYDVQKMCGCAGVTAIYTTYIGKTKNTQNEIVFFLFMELV